MTASRVSRAAVAVAAVVVIAWLAIIERDTRLQSQGLSALRADRTLHATHEFERARLLNPDTTPDLTLGLVYFGLRRPRKAKTTIERVLRSEPQSLLAWADLALVTKRYDPVAAALARGKIRRLDPLNVRRVGG